MKTLRNAALLTVMSLALVPLRAQTATDFDKSVDFTQFKTYTWSTPDIQVGNNPTYKSGLITKNIETSLTDELARRGLTMNPENPDLLVGFHTYTEKKVDSYGSMAPSPMYYPFGYRAGWRYYPYGFANWPYAWNGNFRNVPYTEGTLIIDVVNARTKQLIWRGSAEGNVSDPSRLEKEISRGIHKIMKDYPVKAERE